MRFIGNHHALHFGGHTFVNDVTLVNYVIKEMIRRKKTDVEQEEITEIINHVVHTVEQELRDELKQKHYHQDLHVQETVAQG